MAISKDDSTRSLIITGSPGDVETAETIIKQLEIGLKEPVSEPRTTVMLTLVNHKIDRIYRNIESLVNERMNGLEMYQLIMIDIKNLIKSIDRELALKT